MLVQNEAKSESLATLAASDKDSSDSQANLRSSQSSSPQDTELPNSPLTISNSSLSSGSSTFSPQETKDDRKCVASNGTDPADYVTIIHFNDCYNIEPSSQSSGAAGFLTAINRYRHLNPMILFSGDILSPSFMSTFTKGEQMIPVLNDIGVHCAVFGNHEFDYGVDNLISFTQRTNFPWLLSNVIDKETSNQLGDGLVFHILQRANIKFGIIGLIEEEWLSTLSTVDTSDVLYEDFVMKGQTLARRLKSEPYCVDYVIALTHFRTPNDIKLADSVPEIDLILGGHDHDYEIMKRPNCYIIKSGTDFREFSLIKLKINPAFMSARDIRQVNGEKPFEGDPIIDHIRSIGFEPDKALKEKLDKFAITIDEKMVKVLGQFNCELDGRFASIRKFETNLGNFVTDIMLASTHADLAILNSGTLRSDRIHPKGNFTMRDLFNILGYIDPIAVLDATGYHIWRALENGVSQWPKLEGRFPQISGCTFKFDPNKPALKRIDPKDITIGDEQLVLEKRYRLTTKAYLASGKDGYDILKECKVLVPGDESPDLTTSILNHFEAINMVKSKRRTHHRQSIICLSRSSLQKMLHQTPDPLNMRDRSPVSDSPSFPDARQQEILSETSECDDNNNLNETDSIAHESDTRDSHRESPANGCIKANSSICSTPDPSLNFNSTTIGFDTPPSASVRLPRKRQMSVYEIEYEQCKLEPKVEGRIRIVGYNDV